MYEDKSGKQHGLKATPVQIAFKHRPTRAYITWAYDMLLLSVCMRSWEEKLPMSSTPLESTWLYHEIGRCYLEIGKFDQAKDYGERSKTSAMDAEDDVWQLNASVLIAQAHGRWQHIHFAGNIASIRLWGPTIHVTIHYNTIQHRLFPTYFTNHNTTTICTQNWDDWKGVDGRIILSWSTPKIG